MKKLLKKLAIWAFIIAIISISTLLISGSNDDSYLHSHTKAMCNSTNYCQDYEIHCNKELIIKMSPITGAAVQFPETWQDPRDEKLRNEIC